MMKKFSLWLLISLVALGTAATDLHVFIDTGTSMYKGGDGWPKDLYKTAGSAGSAPGVRIVSDCANMSSPCACARL